jgi:hypothetical protein
LSKPLGTIPRLDVDVRFGLQGYGWILNASEFRNPVSRVRDKNPQISQIRWVRGRIGHSQKFLQVIHRCIQQPFPDGPEFGHFVFHTPLGEPSLSCDLARPHVSLPLGGLVSGRSGRSKIPLSRVDLIRENLKPSEGCFVFCQSHPVLSLQLRSSQLLLTRSGSLCPKNQESCRKGGRQQAPGTPVTEPGREGWNHTPIPYFSSL